jgi:hypothetical protein
MLFSSFVRGVLLVICVFSVTACQKRQPPLYHYNDYCESYYTHKKDMSADSLLVLQKSIEEAIKAAGESKSGRVPPGMYANLGYIYLKGGKSQEAVGSFMKEKNAYPESAHFMDRMIRKVEITEGVEK